MGREILKKVFFEDKPEGVACVGDRFLQGL